MQLLNQVFLQLYDPLALVEWLVASVVLVVVVTLIYKYVLGNSPPPESLTVAKLEQEAKSTLEQSEPNQLLNRAETELRNNNLSGAVEGSIEVVRQSLTQLLRKSKVRVEPNMGVNDLAYLVQSREVSGPQIADPISQLNNLRLKIAQDQPIDSQQASWAVSFSAWLIQAVQGDHIKLS